MLGWTEEGAKRYAEDFAGEPGLGIDLTSQGVLTIFIIGISLLLLFLVFKPLLREKGVKDFPKLYDIDKDLGVNYGNEFNSVVEDSINSQVKIKENSHPKGFPEKTKKPFFKYLSSNFNDTSIKIAPVMEHFLLLFVISLEAFIYLFNAINNSHGKLKDVDTLELKNVTNKVITKLDLEDRKKFLMKKTNLQLRGLLRGIPNISKLKKIQLVDRILLLEFGSKV